MKIEFGAEEVRWAMIVSEDEGRSMRRKIMRISCGIGIPDVAMWLMMVDDEL